MDAELPEFIESFFACWKLGLVAVPVNPRLRGVDVAFHAADSGAAALIHSPEFAEGAAEVEVVHRIEIGGRYDALVAANARATDQTRAVTDDFPAWLFYTSGTTGRPKGAVLTHGNLTFVAVSWCADLFSIQPEDVVLHCAPLSHGAGFHALTAVARGAENVVSARSDPGEILAAIARHRVTAAWLVPTQIRMLLDHPDLDRADLSSLVSVVYGGAPMYRSDLVEAVERIGPVFCQLYRAGRVADDDHLPVPPPSTARAPTSSRRPGSRGPGWRSASPTPTTSCSRPARWARSRCAGPR